MTMLPATWMGARRRTILVFTDRGRTRHAVTRYAVGDLFPAAWDPATEPNQWDAVTQLLRTANPMNIDVSSRFALADGMSHTEHGLLVAGLGDLATRIVPGEPLAIGWLETRTTDEVHAFRKACAIAHSILRTALSPVVVTPGETTTLDVEWWLRERTSELRLGTWFHPTVSVQRDSTPHQGTFAHHPADDVIQPGDLIHIDFGIEYLGMNTDQQQHAYVLLPGETAAPAGLTRALAVTNRLQDLLMAEFAVGRTGNEILSAARTAAAEAGIDATIYTHPLGVHGHAAGPTIGLWDQQEGVPGSGDYPMYADTAYSIELSAASTVPEWDDQTVRIMLEEDAFFDGTSVVFMDGRQEEFWLIPS